MSEGAAGIERLGAGDAARAGFQAVGAEVGPRRLREMLTYPPTWGSTQWVRRDCAVTNCMYLHI